VRVAVVGHLEWVELVRVAHVPLAGDIVHGVPILAVAAGGGAVAAVQLARWGAECHFFTAFGDDALGHRAHDDLAAWGVHVHATFRPAPQRRAVTLVDDQRDRTIIVIGERAVAHGGDPLPWEILDTCAAVYITGGDTQALHHARRARVAVSTARILPALREANIVLDALVGSDNDAAERYVAGDLPVTPVLSVRTDGARGGTFEIEGTPRRHYAAVPAQVTGDTYGAGDTFAAGLTFALGEGRGTEQAIEYAATRAAEVVAFDGPYPPRSS